MFLPHHGSQDERLHSPHPCSIRSISQDLRMPRHRLHSYLIPIEQDLLLEVQSHPMLVGRTDFQPASSWRDRALSHSSHHVGMTRRLLRWRLRLRIHTAKSTAGRVCFSEPCSCTDDFLDTRRGPTSRIRSDRTPYPWCVLIFGNRLIGLNRSQYRQTRC